MGSNGLNHPLVWLYFLDGGTQGRGKFLVYFHELEAWGGFFFQRLGPQPRFFHKKKEDIRHQQTKIYS